MSEDRDLLMRWVAGFFDGEGCAMLISYIQKSHRTTPKVACRVSLYQQVKEPLLLLKELFPASQIHRKPPRYNRLINSKSGYEWVMHGAPAMAFCAEITPYSHVKRSQLEVIARFASLPWRYSRSDKVFIKRTLDQIVIDEGLVVEMRRLKHGEDRV